jgi:SOS response regulatory protein OraA/RecX
MLEFDNDLDKFKAIKEACLQYLVRREHSQKELLRKVSEKGFARPDIGFSSSFISMVEELAPYFFS